MLESKSTDNSWFSILNFVREVVVLVLVVVAVVDRVVAASVTRVVVYVVVDRVVAASVTRFVVLVTFKVFFPQISLWCFVFKRLARIRLLLQVIHIFSKIRSQTTSARRSPSRSWIQPGSGSIALKVHTYFFGRSSGNYAFLKTFKCLLKHVSSVHSRSLFLFFVGTVN